MLNYAPNSGARRSSQSSQWSVEDDDNDADDESIDFYVDGAQRVGGRNARYWIIARSIFNKEFDQCVSSKSLVLSDETDTATEIDNDDNDVEGDDDLDDSNIMGMRIVGDESTSSEDSESEDSSETAENDDRSREDEESSTVTSNSDASEYSREMSDETSDSPILIPDTAASYLEKKLMSLGLQGDFRTIEVVNHIVEGRNDEAMRIIYQWMKEGDTAAGLNDLKSYVEQRRNQNEGSLRPSPSSLRKESNASHSSSRTYLSSVLTEDTEPVDEELEVSQSATSSTRGSIRSGKHNSSRSGGIRGSLSNIESFIQSKTAAQSGGKMKTPGRSSTSSATTKNVQGSSRKAPSNQSSRASLGNLEELCDSTGDSRLPKGNKASSDVSQPPKDRRENSSLAKKPPAADYLKMLNPRASLKSSSDSIGSLSKQKKISKEVKQVATQPLSKMKGVDLFKKFDLKSPASSGTNKNASNSAKMSTIQTHEEEESEESEEESDEGETDDDEDDEESEEEDLTNESGDEDESDDSAESKEKSDDDSDELSESDDEEDSDDSEDLPVQSKPQLQRRRGASPPKRTLKN